MNLIFNLILKLIYPYGLLHSEFPQRAIWARPRSERGHLGPIGGGIQRSTNVNERICRMRSSARLEQEDSNLPHVEVDEVLGLVRDVGAEVAPHNAVPGGVVLLVEFFLNIGGDVLLDVELLQGHIGAVDGVLLHFLVHVGVLDHCLSLCCRHWVDQTYTTNRHAGTIYIQPGQLALGSIINQQPMRSQLQRILNSDLSEYKLAVGEQVSSLEHFEECLTERSTYMRQFNEMLRKELELMGETTQATGHGQEQKHSWVPEIDTETQRNQGKQGGQCGGCTRLGARLKSQVRHLQMLVQKCRAIQQNMQEEMKRLISQICVQSASVANQLISTVHEHSSKKYMTIIAEKQQQLQEIRAHIQDRPIPMKELRQKQSEKQNRPPHRIPSTSKKPKLDFLPMDSQILDTIDNYTYSSMDSVRRSMGSALESCIAPATQAQSPTLTVNNTNPSRWNHYICSLQSPVLFHPSAQPDAPVRPPDADQPRTPSLLTRTAPPLPPSYNLPTLQQVTVTQPPVEHGYGCLTLGGEVVYRGMWKGGRFHGRGVLGLRQWAYEGEFVEGRCHGRGRLRLGQGVEYTGEFREGKANGEGKMTVGGREVRGLWACNELRQIY